MKSVLALFFFIVSGLCAQESSGLRRSIDSMFSRFNSDRSPGCALAVVDDGKLVFEGFYGMSNLEYKIPIGKTSKFHVASMSKQFTAAAIIRLAQEGRISLADDIRKYIPEVPNFEKKITIDHLLHHTSGLRDQWEMLSLAGWRDGDLVTEKDIMDMVKRQKQLNFVPGEDFLYSNTGYTLLGIAVKRVLNVSLKEYADSVFFKPLGMNNTHFQSDHAAIIADRTSAYFNDNSSWKISVPVFDNYGATSLFTTVEDLVKWDSLFYSNSVSGRVFTEMMYRPGMLNNNVRQIYASGLILTNISGHDAIEHSGADAAYRSYFLRVPEKHFSVYILANVDDIDLMSASREIFQLLHGNEISGKSGSAVDKVSIDSVVGSKWAGTYYDPVTQVIHRINFRNNQFFIGWWGLQPLSDSAFAAGPLTKFTFNGNRGKVVMTKIDKGNANVVYQRVSEGSRRSVKDLKQYAGKYYCSELGVYYTLELCRNEIVVNVPRNESIKFTFFLPDIFEGEYNFVIKFKRDHLGRVSGYYLSNGRVRNLYFNRVP